MNNNKTYKCTIILQFVSKTNDYSFVYGYLHEDTSPEKGTTENYQSIQWTEKTTHLLKRFYDIAPLAMQCNQSDGTRFPVSQPTLNISR